MAIISSRKIRKNMGIIAFESALIAETDGEKVRRYSIPARGGENLNVSVRVCARIDKRGLTHYRAELEIGEQCSLGVFNDSTSTIKWLSERLIEEHKRNGHIVI